ncbi:hypothetical protein HDU80_002115 [Chytriomyces hyalinus]|nr:hypothetical protein HDU80_002115 [Chytriomyces hyalinus]
MDPLLLAIDHAHPGVARDQINQRSTLKELGSKWNGEVKSPVSYDLYPGRIRAIVNYGTAAQVAELEQHKLQRNCK